MSGIIIFKSDVGDFPTYLKFIVNFIKLFGAVLLWCKSLFSCSVWLIANKYSCFTSILPTRNIIFAGGMCAPKRQKFNTDDINQSLHY